VMLREVGKILVICKILMLVKLPLEGRFESLVLDKYKKEEDQSYEKKFSMLSCIKFVF
jgi:hypothetical protein